MLSKAEMQLVQRDPTLKGFRHCLDIDVVKLELQSCFPDLRVQDVAGNYIRYKPGRSCLMGYRAQTAEGTRWIHAKAFAQRDRDKLRKIAQATAGMAESSIRLFPRDGYYYALFPFDAAIPALASVHKSQSIDQRILCEVGADDGSVMWLGYKPERRVVGRVCLSGAHATCEIRPTEAESAITHAVVRMYTRDGFHSAARRWKMALPNLGLVTPRRVANCQSIAALATEWIPGEFFSSSDPKRLCEFTSQIPALCESLARLHTVSEANLPVRSPESTSADMEDLARDLAYIVPEQEARICTLFQKVQRRLVDSRFPYRLIHGDLHLGQLLSTPHGLALLDWDELAHGDPASDLASLVAHLYLDNVQSGSPRDEIDQIAEILRQEYNRSGTGIGDLHWRNSLAVAVCRLCMQPFRIRSSHWEEKIESLLQCVQHILATTNRTPVMRSVASPSMECSPSVSLQAVTEDCKLLPSSPLDDLGIERLPLPGWRASESTSVSRRLRRIRVTRHKPKRRMLVEYELELRDPSGESTFMTVVGKVRFRGLRTAAYATQTWLASQGFALEVGPDGGDRRLETFQVPRVWGTVPRAGTWLQEYRSGLTVTSQLQPELSGELPARIARGLAELHRQDFPAEKTHTWDDELAILNRRIDEIAETLPNLKSRLHRLKCNCRDLASGLAERPLTGIHRDFYPAQILVDGPVLVFLDFDLACRGDPAIDAGNFIAHVVEHSVRHFGDMEKLAHFSNAFRDEYARQSEVSVEAIEVCTTLSLARLVALSRCLPHRESTTLRLLEICENRLADHSVETS